MEYHILFTIMAIATILGLSVSTAAAMEEKNEFELPESGRVITFSDNVTSRMMGGLDPPGAVASRKSNDFKAGNRFEMGESGIIIDFNPRVAGAPLFGAPRIAPSVRPRSDRAASGPPVLEAYEMPESGRLVVFPRQVELRREQAARMQVLDRTVSDKR
jgi:hypothetical protein